MKKHNVVFSLSLAMGLLTSSAFAGSITVLDHQASGSQGTVQVRANAVKRVTLVISDTGANTLVSATGIDFGTVDASGTPGAVAGVASGGNAQYLGSFIFSANRSGTGNVTLVAQRSVAGNFNAADGVVIEDLNGTVQPLTGAGGAVTVISNKPSGDFNKKLGITVHSTDTGALTSTLMFTLSAL